MPKGHKTIPRREFGSSIGTKTLPATLPLVGLGCSSFSQFFWSSTECSEEPAENWTPGSMRKDHPRVQQWMKTIHFAVEECGINLLDTAPWYGHGTSEIVIGWAVEKLQPIREDIIINTKVGRYESDPSKQFDFSRSTTLASVQRSLRRLNCSYIDVLQLHDPEFAPSLDQLMNETIPAMIECRKNGWCRALGMTGYPLEVQFQIFQRTKEDFGEIHVWDQALTYGHFNLHDSSLLNKPICSYQSFAEYCRLFEIGLMAAAPLSMGLLTNGNPPEWHPANAELTEACRKAAVICEDLNVDIAVIASVFALSNPRIPCTIIGCRDVTEVEHAAAMANRFKKVDSTLPQEEILKIVFTENELKAFRILSHPKSGPFSKVWSNGNFQWDGVQSARDFWRDGNGIDAKEWQIRPID